MKEVLHQRAMRFRDAFAGVAYALRTQPNARFHAASTVAVLLVSLWLRISRLEWAAIALAITLVWTAELINTAVEAAVDLASPEHNPLASVAKDVAAGAVLVAAVGSVAVGLLILGPPLWARLTG